MTWRALCYWLGAAFVLSGCLSRSSDLGSSNSGPPRTSVVRAVASFVLPPPEFPQSERLLNIRWTNVEVWSDCRWVPFGSEFPSSVALYLLDLTGDGVAYGRHFAGMESPDIATLQMKLDHPRFRQRALILDRAKREFGADYDTSVQNDRMAYLLWDQSVKQGDESWRLMRSGSLVLQTRLTSECDM